MQVSLTSGPGFLGVIFAEKCGEGRLVVEQQPIHAELLNDVLEFAEIHGLLNVAVHAQLVALHQVRFFLGGGQDDDGNCFRARVALYLLENLQAVDLRELEVEKNKAGRAIEAAAGEGAAAEEEIERFGAVANELDLVCELAPAESVESQLRVGRIVFDEEDFNFLVFGQGPPRFVDSAVAGRAGRRA